MKFFGNQMLFATMLTMTSSLRIQIIAGTATLVCLLVIGGAFILLREIGPGPASLLPAERTVLLVTNMPPSMQQSLQDILPDIKEAPLREEGTDVAALVRTGKKMEWITFDAHGTPSTQTPLLQEGETALSSDSTYSRLSATYTSTVPWIFARFPETKLHIEGITIPSSPMTITMGTGSVRVAWPSRISTGFTGPVTEWNAESVLHLNAASFSSFIEQASSILADTVRLPADTLIRSWISRTIGKEVSVHHDLARALDGPGAMLIATESGALEIALRALPSRSAEEMLKKIEQGALGNAIGAEHVQRTFDEKFTFETMKAGESITPTQEERGAWSMHTIAPEMFMTARHNREFILATSRTLMMNFIEATMGNAEQHIADGMVKEKQMTELLHRWHIPLNLPWKLVPGTGDSVVWAIDRQGSLAILTVGR